MAARRNPRRKNLAGEELIIFGNPTRPRGHKAGCQCPICARQANRGRGKRYKELVKQGYSGEAATRIMLGLGPYDPFPKRKPKTMANRGRGKRYKELVKQGYSGEAATRIMLGLGPYDPFPKRKPKTMARPRPNPGVTETEQAVQLFESFHGKQAKEVIEEQRSAAMRRDYAALGDLVAVGFGTNGMHGDKLAQHWDKCPAIVFEGDGVKLASSPNGKQLYAIGGDQDIEECLGDFEHVDAEKDLVDLGEGCFVVYDARKVHSNFEPVTYTHEFGEGGYARPRLLYDRLKREIVFAGGEYFIDAKHGVSPGIEH